MSWEPGAKPKRFYQDVSVVEAEGGWGVALDARPLRTPSRASFVAPRGAAERAAEEWRAQGETIDPNAMPATRAINTAIDRVAPQRDAVAAEIAGYGGTDLLCYRADGPLALIERQAQVWDPVLDWCARDLGAPLRASAGVMHIEQAEASLARLAAIVADRSDLGLATLHELTTLSGSLVLALAVDRRRLAAEAAWSASRIDEDWQIEQWGEDAEAAAVAMRRKQDFMDAAALNAALWDDG